MSDDKKKILTKSRYTKGLQCEKLLWLELHEPDADELEIDAQLQKRFDVGIRVGELARTYVPDGVLIDREQNDLPASVEETRKAISRGAEVLYEGAVCVDDIYCAIDILERADDHSWTLIEVKSSTKVKEEYLPDVAVQAYAARRAGLDIKKVEIMVLNRECRYPDLSNLFVRHDVTNRIDEHMQQIEANAKRLLKTIRMATPPKVKTGDHCWEPRECPFLERCHGKLPEHHLGTLYKTNEKTIAKLKALGYEILSDIEDTGEAKLSVIQIRQVKAVKHNKVVVEKGLADNLGQLIEPLAYMDFETVMPAIPVWDNCRPYEFVVAQFSCHKETKRGLEHHEWIVQGRGDKRREAAEALVKACTGAATILVFYQTFEKQRIEDLAGLFPDLAPALVDISSRIVDLLPIVRNHVYHPKFHGKFSLKKVLPALCPELSYEKLNIKEGGTASIALEAIMTDPEQFKPDELEKLVKDLKEYCKLDTLAMVKLVERLRAMASKKVASR